MKVLITSGGTCENLDGVRVITNLSSGSTGNVLANEFTRAGHTVHLLKGRFTELNLTPEKSLRFDDFNDLEKKLQYMLGRERYDAVIHLAAVSDFSPAEIIYDDGRRVEPSYNGKLPSSEEFTVRFRKNHKIIDRIRSFSEKEIILIGFKLTNTQSAEEQQAAVDALLSRGCCDLVVHNDLFTIGPLIHKAAYYSQAGRLGETMTKEEMAAWLMNYLKERI